MSIDHDPQSTGTSKHPLEHGLEAPVAIPPAGQRHEDYFPKKNVLRRVIGGTAVVAILAGGGLLAKSMLGGSNAPSAENPAPNPDRTVSAPATIEAPAPVKNSDISEAEVSTLLAICANNPMNALSKKDLYKLNQDSVNNVRIMVDKALAMPDNEERWNYCNRITNAIWTDLGL